MAAQCAVCQPLPHPCGGVGHVPVGQRADQTDGPGLGHVGRRRGIAVVAGLVDAQLEGDGQSDGLRRGGADVVLAGAAEVEVSAGLGVVVLDRVEPGGQRVAVGVAQDGAQAHGVAVVRVGGGEARHVDRIHGGAYREGRGRGTCRQSQRGDGRHESDGGRTDPVHHGPSGGEETDVSGTWPVGEAYEHRPGRTAASSGHSCGYGLHSLIGCRGRGGLSGFRGRTAGWARPVGAGEGRAHPDTQRVVSSPTCRSTC